MIVATPDGRADFELLTTRLNRRPGDPTPGPPVSLYIFDILRTRAKTSETGPGANGGPSSTGSSSLSAPKAAARPTVVSPDGTAMLQATADIGAEGSVSKDVRSIYRGGRSRRWLTMCSGLSGVIEVGDG